MHLDQEQLQRLLHGELVDEESHAAKDHMNVCSPCLARLREAEEDEREIFDLLARLDHPTPVVDPALMRARARTQHFRWGRWAAGVLLALGVSSAAYAAPGSPLPSLVKRIALRFQSPSPAPTVNPEDAASLAYPSGITVSPGSRLSILFSSHQVRGQLRIELTDESDVSVRSMSGVWGFTSEIERILVENEGSQTDFEIQIPRSAPRVEILVGGELRFSKVGGQITASAPADEEGRFLVPLRPPDF